MRTLLLLALTIASITPARAAEMDIQLGTYNRSCGVDIAVTNQGLLATWQAANHRLGLNLNPGSPDKLIASLDIDGQTVLKDADLEYTLTVGSRKAPAAAERFGYVFFDKPASRDHKTYPAKLEWKNVALASAGKRATIRLSKLSAGPFSGDLEIHIYAGSPLLHVQAAMTPTGKDLAYIYDATIKAAPMRLAYQDVEGQLHQVGSGADTVTTVAVKHRTIVAESDAGSVALFPAPHAFFFPRDLTTNLKFVQYGQGRFGLRQDPAGGGAFVPWFDAPEGKPQRMDCFLLLSRGKAPEAIEAVRTYTHGDAFKPLPGRLTFTSHYHAKLTVSEMAGKRATEEFARVFKAMGVNIVHLAEFHGDGHFDDRGQTRLNELKTMFDLCRKYSDDTLLLVPGEEGIRYAADPWPPARGIHPGHWMYLFPKPVYLTWVAAGDQFVEDVPGYGRVYHIGDRDQLMRLFATEHGIGWTTHPRIKASFATPDAFKDQDWYRQFWLGAAWKAMPGNLADDRLGRRCLDLLDDMSNWAVAGNYDFKRLPGEVDVFEIDHTHELYGHMNINYLKLAQLPSKESWPELLDVLKRGDFFTTTGEILIHAFDLRDGKVTADLEWTLPLAFAEIVTGDGQNVRRQRIELPQTQEMTRQQFTWPLQDRGAKWVRLEVWDIARDGAYTQVAKP
jgi:hypothetical protein